MGDTILQMNHISKSFSGVYALKDANLTLKKGKVMALVGENGAGKSTLMRILTGIYKYDDGEVVYNGNVVNFRNAMESRDAGIAIIHQEFNAFPNLTVAENIYIGSKEILNHGFISWRSMKKKAAELIEILNGRFSVDDKVADLSVQDQQLVEIVKALSTNAEVIIMDEPTSALSGGEVELLFGTIRRLKEQGVAIVFVSHRLNEIFEICDEITVLRDGVTSFTSDIKDTNQDEVVSHMIGKELTSLYPESDRTSKEEVVFEVRDLDDGNCVKNLSFSVHAGEILGLYGLVGSGATECPDALFGIHKKRSGTFLLKGKEVSIKSAADAVEHKMAYVPSDRHREGIITPLSIRYNLSFVILKALSKFGFVDRKKEKQIVLEYIEKLRIKCTDENQLLKHLSGGNQQKVVISKWLALEPDILLLNDPTRGVDVGAKAEIYSLINDLAKEGLAIIITSSEIDEILGLADRIIVMNEGTMSQTFLKQDADQEKLLSAALIDKRAEVVNS